jgi:outer membrane protein
MYRARPYLAIACSLLLLAPAGSMAADNPLPTSGHGLLGKISSPYRPGFVPAPNMANSPRLESLLRAGNLYLSLQDTIALALENNLDIAIQRYGPQIADAALASAEAGSFARGVSTSVTAGPSSATVSSAGTAAGGNLAASSQASTANASAVAGSVLQTSGPAIPALDPSFGVSGTWSHTTQPQSNSVLTGNTASVSQAVQNNFALSKGFLTGTSISLGMTNNSITNNALRSDFNPATTANLGITFTQHLLQGFGVAVNARQIHIARNNREVADLTFKLQVITTVAAVMELYWDLVAFHQNVEVAQNEMASAQRLYQDNKRQVEVGTLAQLEVIRAEAQMASAEEALVVAQTQLLQQETILKTALSKNGVASPAVAEEHIIPTDQIRIPDSEPLAPIQEMMGMAISSRPELAQSRIQVTNQELALKGSKNGVLPTLDAVASMSNNALAGDVNQLGSNHSNNPFFIGGYSTVLQQIFNRNFPNYSVGFNLNIPIRNRAAQAQVINDELSLRQQEMGLQRLQNQVRVDVQNALIAVTQARAQYRSAARARILQAQTLDAEQKKLEAGASTVYNVIADQQALAAAQYTEVQAESAYAKSKVELDRATGQLLYHNNISLEEAYKGVVSRPPTPPSAGDSTSQKN